MIIFLWYKRTLCITQGFIKMDTTNLFKDNFEKIQKGINWLKENIEFDEEEIKQKIKELKEPKGDSLLSQYETWLKIKCKPADFLAIFALGFLDNQIIQDFKKCAEKEEFWNEDLLEDYLQGTSDENYFWNFLYEMGLASNSYFLKYFNDFKNDTTEEGRMWNDIDHVCFLRLAIALEPQSPITNKVLKYSLQNNHHQLDVFESSIFILALTELDFYKYKETIEEGIRHIKNLQNEDGSWGENSSNLYREYYYVYRDTYFAIKAICRVNGSNDEHLKKGIDFILQSQKSDGTWGYFENQKTNTVFKITNLDKEIKQSVYHPDKDMTSFALLSLLMVSPPFSLSNEEYMFKDILIKQKMYLFS